MLQANITLGDDASGFDTSGDDSFVATSPDTSNPSTTLTPSVVANASQPASTKTVLLITGAVLVSISIGVILARRSVMKSHLGRSTTRKF